MYQIPRARLSVRRLVRMPALVGAVAIILAGVMSSSFTGARAQEHEGFKNLKVFPEDIQKKDLVNSMKSFARSLGVRCSHCHVGEGDDLSTYDFPSDEKRAKNVARKMIQMVRSVNTDTIAKLPPKKARAADAKPVRVRCVTCHRGNVIPEIKARKKK